MIRTGFNAPHAKSELQQTTQGKKLPIPAKPSPAAALPLAPFQGDHVFGDIVGMVDGALSILFGGMQGWEANMLLYNPILRAHWQTMSAMDLGHVLGPNQPVVQRTGLAEPDEHAHVFGGYAARFRWQVEQAPHAGQVGHYFQGQWGGYAAWKRKVLSAFDDVAAHSVDSTALAWYLAQPTVIRPAAPAVVRHATVSIRDAKLQALGGGATPARVRTVCDNVAAFRSRLEGLLIRIDRAIP